jgi:alpha-ribazole phosphatase
MSDTLVDLLRHGEPQGGRRYRGHGCDDPLSELGWEQMWRTVGGHAPWQQVVTSPMRRCQDFAETLAARYRLPLAVEERFKEVGLGSWEGKTPEQIMAWNPAEYDAFYLDSARHRPTGAEPLETFIARVGEAFDVTLAAFAGHHILIVGHAGVIRAVIGHVLQADPSRWYRIAVDYAGATRIRKGRHGRVLEFHNRRSFAEA